jgi:HlyD family secretion protein
MKKLMIWIGICVILIVVVFVGINVFGKGETSKIAETVLGDRFFKKAKAPTDEYKLAPVTKGDIQALVTSTGRLSPLNTVKVGSQISGIIKEIYVDFNSEVTEGQVIALIDPAIYAAQVEQAKAHLLMAKMQRQERLKDIVAAKAGVESAEASLDSARATLREAELRYNRLVGLGHNEIVAKSDQDSALAKRDNAKGAVQIAEAKIRTSKAQLKRVIAQEKGALALIAEREAALSLTETKLKYCTITSPIDGVVISRSVDVGQTVAATLQSPVLFTIAEDLTRMQVEVDVSEADVGQINSGQTVEFNVDAFLDKKFKAKVRQVRNVATNIQNVVTYKIIADVANNELLLRPGMTANVNIIVAKVNGVLKVPNAALRFKPLGEIEEAKPRQPRAIKERPMYKQAIMRLKMDSEQARAFEEIIKKADAKLKAVYALPEEERDLKQAWGTYFISIYKNLYEILRQDQYQEFGKYTRELREANQKRRKYKGRPAKVYILDESGQPKSLGIMAGITNDTETQIIQGELKQGDKVIVGLVFGSGGGRKRSGSLFSTLLKRR